MYHIPQNILDPNNILLQILILKDTLLYHLLCTFYLLHSPYEKEILVQNTCAHFFLKSTSKLPFVLNITLYMLKKLHESYYTKI